MTKVDLITGILGSGKTTFIRKYAQYFIRQGKRIAILLNDYGAVNIDMAMLSDLKCDNCELTMIVGGADADCYKRRFKTQLISLGMQHFDRVIIEPSGIFDMDQFFDTLYESPLDKWFECGSIITVADAGLEDELSDEMEFMLGSEAACCGKLILSKLENTSEEVSQVSAHIISHINRSLEFIKCRRRFSENDMLSKKWNDLTDEDFASLSMAGYRNESYVKLYNRDTVTSKVHYFMHINMDNELISSVINNIMTDLSCGKVFRIKGSLPADDGSWIRINCMPDSFSVTPAAEGQAVLIVIGDNLSKEKIDEYLKSVNTDPEYVSI